jgi:hypothetical protein
MIEHGCLSRRLAWLTRVRRVTAQDRTGMATQATLSLIGSGVTADHGASLQLAPPWLASAGQFALRASHDHGLRAVHAGQFSGTGGRRA